MVRARPTWNALVPYGALALIAAAYTVLVAERTAPGALFASYDMYGAQTPDALYILDSLKRGHGLLWTSLQASGQPFLPGTMLGPFYPLHALLLVFDIPTAFAIVTVVHLAMAGGFAYWLCREYGVDRMAAFCGGVAFMLGGTAVALATWMPTTIFGPFVWMPAAMAMVERTLRSPTFGNVVGLAVCLTLGFLGGFPQTTFFTYLVLGLRILWALATDRRAWSVRTLGALAIGTALPALLGAVYLLPAFEFGAESVRTGMSEYDALVGGVGPWELFRIDAGSWTNGFLPLFALIPTALAGVALTDGRHRSILAFYVLCAVLFLALAYWEPLYRLYFSIPQVRAFRHPMRFRWVVSFAIAVPVALGVQALLSPSRSPRFAVPWRLAGLAAGTALFFFLSTRPLERWETVSLMLVAMGVAVAGLVPAARSGAGLVTAVLVTLNLFVVGWSPFLKRMPDIGVLFANRPAFAALAERMTVQDRFAHVATHPDYSLMAKSASVFGVRSILDYESQVSRRYADLLVRLFRNQWMENLAQLYFLGAEVPLNVYVSNLLATRWLLVDDRALAPKPASGGGRILPTKQVPRDFVLRWQDGHIALYENPAALPRAYFVPRVEVIRDPAALRNRLASGAHDPRRVALIETPPADGFLGSDPSGQGEITAMQDESETVRLHLTATSDGFLILTDQDYPGWQATVNGVPTPVRRANYAFRVIRVPAGESDVVFRYRPRSFSLGALLSLASVTALVAIPLWRRRRRA